MSTGTFGQAQAEAERLREIYPKQMAQTVAALKYVASEQNTYAREYYESERANVIAAAKQFDLHPYFDNPDMANAEPNWNGVLAHRMKYFRTRYEAEGRRDFDVEKDRCAMYRFFTKHDLPMLATHGEWDDLSQLKDAVVTGQAFQNVTDFPVFWKACHLTQGSALGTRSMKALPNTAEQKNELTEWFDEKWDFRAHDYERVWVEDGDVITRDIPAGFMLQAPFKGALNAETMGRVTLGLMEVRVEVMWGRAYLGILDGMYLFMRNGATQDFGSLESFFGPAPVSFDHFFFEKGYDKCAWAVAEKAAKAAGIESVRVDIFLDPNDPSKCIMNEISVSSGMPYQGNEDYMTKLWQDGFREQWYSVRDTELSVLEQ